MAQVYATGPGLLFVSGAALSESGVSYLGTAERHPRQQIKAGWEPLFNDLGGQRVPFDILYEGEEAFLSADLTRWNERILNRLMARPGRAASVRGKNTSVDIGTAVLAEGYGLTLWCQFPFASKAAYQNAANGNMPGGFRFPASIMIGPESYESMGTAPKKIRVVFHCLRYFNPTDFSFLLYDHDMSALPAIN